MSWHFSQALVAEYLEDCSKDGKPCARLSGNHQQEKSSPHDKTTEAWNPSQSGTMCKPSTDDRGEELLTWYRAASPAKTLAQPGKGPESVEKDQECGAKWSALCLKCVPDTYSLRTVHSLWEEDLEWCSVTLPRWGMMQNGELWERITLPVHTQESESGSWPTPRCQMARRPNWERVETGNHKCNLEDYTAIKEGLTRGSGKWSLNPEWCEWLMGWPVGWTNATEPLETGKFQSWLRSHGKS